MGNSTSSSSVVNPGRQRAQNSTALQKRPTGQQQAGHFVKYFTEHTANDNLNGYLPLMVGKNKQKM